MDEAEASAVRNEPGGSTEESNPTDFLIRHSALDLRICLSQSELLLLHEETIPDRVAELRDSIQRDGVVKDPIIVDADSCVVLDGMHRVVALRELCCLRMPVCVVDYLNPSIKVGVWYRTLTGRVTSAQFETALLSSGIKVERFSPDMTTMTENSSLAALFAGGESLLLESSGTRAYEVLKIAERCARELRLTVAFETEQDAIKKLMNGMTDAIITLPKIDKASIRTAGLTGRLLPHKVTRHIIPARPLMVNIPVSTLTDETTTLREANEHFVARLRTRGMIQKPAGTVIEGRRYEEETYIFN